MNSAGKDDSATIEEGQSMQRRRERFSKKKREREREVGNKERGNKDK